MNLGDFRRVTAGLADDYEIVASPGDATWWEVHQPAPDQIMAAEVRVVQWPDYTGPVEHLCSSVIILNMGQEVTEDFQIPQRLGLDDE